MEVEEMKDKNTLLEGGWKKEMLCLHLLEYDPHLSFDKEIPFRRLSYDIRDDFSDEQITTIRHFVSKVNEYFPNIKMCVTGTGYYKPTEDEQ